MRWTRTLPWYLSLAFIACVATCRMTTGIDFPSGAEPMEPQPVYRDWWTMVEACAGRTGNFDAIHWYSIGIYWIDGQLAAGVWFEDGNRIVISSPWLLDGGAVRHEMLHALLQRGDHPREYFVTRCGGVISCGNQCSAAESSPHAWADDGVLEPDVDGITTRLGPGRQ
jgi:hypothetical protein